MQQPMRRTATTYHGIPRLITVTSEIFDFISFLNLPLEGTQSYSLLIALSVSFYFNAPFWIKMHSIKTIIAFFLYIYVCVCSLMTLCNHTLWYGQYTRGLRTPQCGVKSSNTFRSAAPRTYSIICISSESCLWSNVGFARLPCFATLRSALSAKAAPGELLRLCPGSSGWAPQ